MRVLIVLALIGVAYAGEAYLAPAPLGYSSLVVDQPKPSYEYSSSVQTPTYNNYAHVRSNGNLERKIYNYAAPIAATPILAAEPIVAEAKILQPAIAQPILKAEPLSTEFRTIAAPALAIPTTKLLPINYETKPILRIAAPAPLSAIVTAAPAAAQILNVETKYIDEGKSQYHSQNGLGEATYGHRETFQSHDAVQDAQGNKAGSFSYVAPDGRLLTTEYIADQAGYRVASNALPNAPNTAYQAAIQSATATVEQSAQINDADSVVVEAKSRSRRSVAITPAAPVLSSRAVLYNSPLTYSYPAISSYSYTAPSAAYSSVYYNSPQLYRSYAYPYSSYPLAYNYALRK